MQWDSWSHFWAMDGHGPFIWGAYGGALLCMLVEAVAVCKRRQHAIREAIHEAMRAQEH